MRHDTDSGISFRERKDLREAGGSVGAYPSSNWAVEKQVVSPGESFFVKWTGAAEPPAGYDVFYFTGNKKVWSSNMIAPPWKAFRVAVPLSQAPGKVMLEFLINWPKTGWDVHNLGYVTVAPRDGFAVPTRRVGVTRRAKLSRRRQRLGRPGRRRRSR